MFEIIYKDVLKCSFCALLLLGRMEKTAVEQCHRERLEKPDKIQKLDQEKHQRADK